tara:strand:+ start:366 stop:785 length:420 start_codon:yes stop_codon:yes gene_type:complete
MTAQTISLAAAEENLASARAELFRAECAADGADPSIDAARAEVRRWEGVVLTLTVKPKPVVSLKPAVDRLAVLNYAQGFTQWHFKAVSLAEVLNPDTFAACQDMIHPGDMIFANAPDGGGIFYVRTDCRVVLMASAMEG